MSRTASLPLCIVAAAGLLAACHKAPAPKNARAKREENSQRQTNEREAVEDFVSAIRAVVEWRHGQTPPQTRASRAASVKEFARRLQGIPTSGLPADVVQDWKDLTQSCERFASDLEKSAPSDQLKKDQVEGHEAGEKLNHWLDSQGFGELHF